MIRTELTEALIDAIQGWQRASIDRAWALRWKRAAKQWLRETERMDAQCEAQKDYIDDLRRQVRAASQDIAQARALLRRAISPPYAMMSGAALDEALARQIKRWLDAVE